MKRIIRALETVGVLVGLVLSVDAGPAAASPSAQVWGACGTMTTESKVVRVFPSPQGPLTLRCGGPRWSDSPAWGYRHLLSRHVTDFDGAAAGTFQNWRDIADLAIETVAADPDTLVPARGDQTCRSRVLFLVNVQTNHVVRQQIFVMYTRNDSNDIVTVFPRDRQCAGPE